MKLIVSDCRQIEITIELFNEGYDPTFHSASLLHKRKLRTPPRSVTINHCELYSLWPYFCADLQFCPSGKLWLLILRNNFPSLGAYFLFQVI